MKHPFSKVSFDYIVYLGAGQGDDVPRLEAELTANNWLLIDADEDNIPALNDVKSHFNEESESFSVQQVLVAAAESDVTWYQYNLSEFNGMQKATALSELFPGLKLTGTQSVKTTALQSLLEPLNLQNENNLLIIDIPGQSLELLKALADTPYKSAFNYVCVTSVADKLFENCNNAGELQSWLRENGYHTRNEAVDDPDFPVFYYSYDHLLAERNEAAMRAAETSKELEQLRQSLVETHRAKDSFEQQNEELTTKVGELNQQLAQATEDKQEQTDRANKLNTQLEKANKEKVNITAERDDAITEWNEAATRASDTSKELEQLKENLTQTQQAKESIEQKSSELTKELKELNQQLSQANEEKQKQTDLVNKLKTQLEEAYKEKAIISTERDDAITKRNEAARRASERSKEVEQLKQSLAQTQQEKDTIEQQNDGLQKKLEAAEKYNTQLAKLNERMDYMFEQQRLQLEQATNALGQHITQTSAQQVTELKARLSLERAFGANLVELNDEASNLTEVTAVSLTQQLEENSYDLIVEFGAGRSTEFLANAIINNHRPNRQIENKSSTNDFDASDFDLPQQILSFEHDKKQFNAVKKRIKQQGLNNLVDLKYTPLVPAQESSELFYDCRRALNHIANLFEGREAKVLIAINPSQANKQPNIIAALGVALESLSALQLDVLVSEKLSTPELTSNWQQLIEDRGLESGEQAMNGVYLLRINP